MFVIMDTSICPVCGKIHQHDSVCPWDFVTNIQDSCAEYIEDRVKNAKTLFQKVAEADRLKNRVARDKEKNFHLKGQLAEKESAIEINNSEIKKYRDISICLEEREKLLQERISERDTRVRQLLAYQEMSNNNNRVKRYIRLLEAHINI